MKKFVLPLFVAAITLSSAFADMRGPMGPGPGRRDTDFQCLKNLDNANRRADTLQLQLNQCLEDSRRQGPGRFDPRELEALRRDNQDLRQKNDLLLNQANNLQASLNDSANQNVLLRQQVEKLKIDNARLEDELHPGRYGFDLAASIRACAGLNNAVYSQQCTQAAKQYSIDATVITQCTQIQNAFYANDCIKNAGSKGVNARQVRSCLLIKNDVYTSQCVGIAGDRRINADIIESCARSSDNAFYQVQCLQSM